MIGMSHDVSLVVLVFGILMMGGLFGAFYGFQLTEGRRSLRHWATQNGYSLLKFRRILLPELAGFPFMASKAQQAFRIVVRFRDGTEKSGSVLLGSLWSGVASGTAKVKWDD